MGERREDGDDSGDPPPDDSGGLSLEHVGDEPLERDPSRDKKPDWGRILIRVIQLLTVLAALGHEVTRLLT
ncbi:hypothetical protein [Amycolatopsis sp. NPDC051716]|uniref:hypothetical protein n=1 Tax=Amycolatopsis sp. NPDC051716 TaxID=3155804 RepID=UPI0034287F7D